jgi:ribosomal protein S18 acetylase RimI-like enzyme
VTAFSPTPVDDPVAAELLDEYFTSRELGFTSHPGGYRIVHPDPVAFTPPAGVFLIATDDDGTVVGCGGVRMLDPSRGEIKHLWMRPTARGTGTGRALLAELERRAADLGATEVVLDTNESLEAAQHIYRTSGYDEVEPYNDNRNATHWFRKVLIERPL